MAISLADLSVFCYACDSYIVPGRAASVVSALAADNRFGRVSPAQIEHTEEVCFLSIAIDLGFLFDLIFAFATSA